MVYLSSLLFSTFFTLMLIPMLMRLSIRLNAVDVPDERKVHSRPIPRLGGIAMVLGSTVPVLLWAQWSPFTKAYLIGVAILVVFGLVDDLQGLGYGAKFIGQAAAALVVVFYGGVAVRSLGTLLPEGIALPAWFSVVLSVVTIVGVTNAINLADGLDGLAGGIGFLSFCCLGYLAYRENHAAVALIAVSLSGALFGFLRFNTHPAALFMGDTGSQLLGFSTITLAIGLTQENTPLSPLLPLIILGFPVLDTLTVMTERIARGRSPFAADRNHFHHRLMRFGFSHRDAVLIIYGLQALLILSAFLLRYHSDWVLLIGYGVFALLILGAFLAADRSGWRYERIPWVDSFIKGPLRIMAEKGILIRVSFRAVEFGIPALLLFTGFLPAALPSYVSVLSASLVLFLVLVLLSRPAWMKWALPLSLYLIIPFLIFFSHADPAGWIGPGLQRIQNYIYLGLAALLLLVLKFTRRKKGFRLTPLDFLIFFSVAVVVPQLPLGNLQGNQLGIVSAKIIMLFFGLEVLIGELRGRLDRLGLAVLLILAVTSLRGLIPWHL